MRRRGIAGVIFLCVLAFTPLSLAAQDAGSGASSRAADAGFELLQNYPNPFTTSTRIPFRLEASLFEQGQPAVVTMRIFNVLQQLVAYPEALSHADGQGVAVNGLEYTAPGQYEALWDSLDLNGRQVTGGIYYLQINVNGRRQIMKMIFQS
jgi:hypothetical protein